MTSCLTAIKNHVIKYCTTDYESNSEKVFWSIKNSGSVGQQVSGLTGTGTQSGTGSGNSQQGSVGQQPSGLTGTGSQSSTGTVQQPSSLTRTGSQSGEGQGAMYGQTTTGILSCVALEGWGQGVRTHS